MHNIDTITIYFIMIAFYFWGLFIYKIERQGIFFGIKLPHEYNKKENFIKLKKEYKRDYSLSCLLLILIYIFLSLKVSEIWSVVIGNLLIFIEMLIICVYYYIMHKKVKSLRQNENWKVESETIDDENYILGRIYYNKNDPSLWVNKWESQGGSLNYARPLAKVFLVFIIGVSILVSLRVLSYPKIFKDREVVVSEDLITIEGKWGVSVNKEEISKVSLKKNLPMVLRRINAVDINKMKMGRYKVSNYKESYFYIMDRSNPFVAIYTKDNKLIVINYEDLKKTEDLYISLEQFKK